MKANLSDIKYNLADIYVNVENIRKNTFNSDGIDWEEIIRISKEIQESAEDIENIAIEELD